MMSAKCYFVIAFLYTLGSLVQANIPVNLGCFDSSNYKWINLVRSYSIGVCSYEIRPYNVFVCQLRVEFSTDLLPAKPQNPGEAPRCLDGSRITIGDFVICGGNQKQHLYIPLEGAHFNNFQIITANLTEGPGLYRIKVTQIECPFGIRRSIQHLSGQFGSWYNNWHYSGASLSSNNALYDAYHVAPESCDQYHMSTRGVVESLDYGAGRGQYPQNFRMKVCFKTPPKSKILRLTGLEFDIEDNAFGQAQEYGTVCNETPGMPTSNDYIIIPSSRILDAGISSDRYCGRILQGRTVESNLYETAHFIFNAGKYKGSRGDSNRIYKFKYEIY